MFDTFHLFEKTFFKSGLIDDHKIEITAKGKGEIDMYFVDNLI